jgi:hypothetical protein
MGMGVMLRWGRILGVGLVASAAMACGSGQPAASADDVEQGADENADVNAEAATDGSDAAQEEGDSADHADDSAAADDARGAEPVAADDVQAVLQLVIDDDALQPFLHLEEPGRFPLRIAFGAEVQNTSGIALTKMTKPVEVVDGGAASDPKAPAILITALSVEKDRARVTYRYKVENVHGTASLAKTKTGHWELVNSTLTER